jgi:hypothetical protein
MPGHLMGLKHLAFLIKVAASVFNPAAPRMSRCIRMRDMPCDQQPSVKNCGVAAMVNIHLLAKNGGDARAVTLGGVLELGTDLGAVRRDYKAPRVARRRAVTTTFTLDEGEETDDAALALPSVARHTHDVERSLRARRKTPPQRRATASGGAGGDTEKVLRRSPVKRKAAAMDAEPTAEGGQDVVISTMRTNIARVIFGSLDGHIPRFEAERLTSLTREIRDKFK